MSTILKYILVSFITIALGTCGAVPLNAGDPNTLTDEEKQSGFELLFNGHDLHDWEPANSGWEMKDGPWKVQDGAMYFQSDRQGFPALAYWRKTIPPDFDLRFEWKESHSVKSGLQGHFVIGTHGAMVSNGWTGWLCCTYIAAERGVNLRTREINIPVVFSGISKSETPSKDTKRPAGQWNEARIVCKGSVFQHWLNGEKILEVDLRHGHWSKMEKKTENLLLDQWLKEKKQGFRLEIENTNVPAWFRNIKVRAIPKDEEIARGKTTSAGSQKDAIPKPEH